MEMRRFYTTRAQSTIEQKKKDQEEIDRAKAQWIMDGNSIKTFGATEPNHIVTNNGKRISTPMDHHKKRWNESNYGGGDERDN